MYTVQEKAWVNVQVFLQWIKTVWSPLYAGVGDETYLLLDEFLVHMKSECMQAIQGFGTEVDCTPGGYTGA